MNASPAAESVTWTWTPAHDVPAGATVRHPIWGQDTATRHCVTLLAWKPLYPWLPYGKGGLETTAGWLQYGAWQTIEVAS